MTDSAPFRKIDVADKFLSEDVDESMRIRQPDFDSMKACQRSGVQSLRRMFSIRCGNQK